MHGYTIVKTKWEKGAVLHQVSVQYLYSVQSAPDNKLITFTDKKSISKLAQDTNITVLLASSAS